jgi:hypothetical protein
LRAANAGGLLNLKDLTHKELYDIRFKGDKAFAQKVALEL